jgi:hypothetical protein
LERKPTPGVTMIEAALTTSRTYLNPPRESVLTVIPALPLASAFSFFVGFYILRVASSLPNPFSVPAPAIIQTLDHQARIA